MANALYSVAVPCSFCSALFFLCFPRASSLLFAKDINKNIELWKYKMYQKEERNRPKEQSNQPRKPGSLFPLPSLTRSSRDPGTDWSRDTLTHFVPWEGRLKYVKCKEQFSRSVYIFGISYIGLVKMYDLLKLFRFLYRKMYNRNIVLLVKL